MSDVQTFDEEMEEEISNDSENGGCCNWIIALFGRLLFRQGYIDLATMNVST